MTDTASHNATPPSSSASEADAPLDPVSMAAIRSMLAEAEPIPVPQTPAKNTGQVAAYEAGKAVRETPEPAAPTAAEKPARRAKLPPLATPEPAAEAPAAPRKKKRRSPAFTARLFQPVMARIKGYRPTAKHIILAALGILVVFRPGLALALVFLALLLFVAIFLVLGYDGFWQRGMAIARWYARRNPARSKEIHAKLDRFAMKWDAVLDRFPEGTVDGLYLPDFQELQAAEDRHAAALERRLKDIRESEA